jgi:signal transduction histidine kinase
MGAQFRRSSFRPPTIRMLVALWAGSALLAWAILVAGWLVAKNELTQIEEQVITDVNALDATHRLESAVRAHRREDLLWYATGPNRDQQREGKYLDVAEQIIRDFHPYISTSKERALWVSIREKLNAFRESLNSASLTLPEEEIRETDDLLAIVGDFQAENQAQMEESMKAANRVRGIITDWAIGLSIGAASSLLVGALSLKRRIIRPTLVLTEAATSFGRGDFTAKASVLHDDELGALARTFNNMAGDIADREKDRLQFVAMVVHDLKNPALAIDMAARTLRGPGVTEEQRRCYLDGIQEEVACLRGIIRDLTDDIQVVNGRFSVHKTDLDLGALVRRFVETQSKSFATHDLVVRTAESCTVRGDADRLNRVLTNLVSNAVKYSPGGTRVTLQIAKEGSQAVLTISDQGPGIPKDDLNVLFQPFGRGRAASTLAEGTGMGLYVVKQIVEAHDGRIDVQSTPGCGATFQICLPLVQARMTHDLLAETQARSG